MLELVYYLALYLGVGWTIAVLAARAREDGDLDPDAHRAFLILATILWPAYVLAITGGSLVAALWWMRSRWPT